MKKADELKILRKFLVTNAVDSRNIVESESPDFILGLADGDFVGVEITEVKIAANYSAESKNSCDYIAKKLEREKIFGGFRLMLDGNAFDLGENRKNRDMETEFCIEIARSNPDGIEINFGNLPEDRKFARLRGLHFRPYAADVTRVYYDLRWRDQSDPRAVLRKKTRMVSKARKEKPEIARHWLLWCVREGSLASRNEPTEAEFLTAGFDRVYLVNATTGLARLMFDGG